MKKLSLLIILLLAVSMVSVLADMDYVAEEVSAYDNCVAKQDANSIYTPGYSICYDAYGMDHLVYDQCVGDSLREVALLESELPEMPADGSQLFYIDEPYTEEGDDYPYQDYFYTYYVDVECDNGCEEVEYEFDGVTYDIGACLSADLDMPEVMKVPECMDRIDNDGDGTRDFDSNGNGGWCDSDDDGSLWDEDAATLNKTKCECLGFPACIGFSFGKRVSGRFFSLTGKQTTAIIPIPAWIEDDPQCTSVSDDSEDREVASKDFVDELQQEESRERGVFARLFNAFGNNEQVKERETLTMRNSAGVSGTCIDSDGSSYSPTETPGTLTCGEEVFRDGCSETSGGSVFVTEYTNDMAECEENYINCEEGSVTSNGVEYKYYWGLRNCGDSGYQCAGDNTEESPGYCMRRRAASVSL